MLIIILFMTAKSWERSVYPYNESIKWKWCLWKYSNAVGRGSPFNTKWENEKIKLCWLVLWEAKIWGQDNVCERQRRGTRGAGRETSDGSAGLVSLLRGRKDWVRRDSACGSTLRKSQPGHQGALAPRLQVQESFIEPKGQARPFAGLNPRPDLTVESVPLQHRGRCQRVFCLSATRIRTLFLEGRSDGWSPHYCKNYSVSSHFWEKKKKRKEEWQRERERGGK